MTRLHEFRRQLRVPAVGAALVGAEGAEWLAVVGERIRRQPAAATTDDRWHIGSCGKSVTAVLTARLVERGAARWDARLPELFPDLQPVMNRGWQEVTLEQILTHRSGLPANLRREDQAAAFDDQRPLVDQRTTLAANALADPPGEVGSFHYSNLGYVVAGAAIERITGQAWELSVVTDVMRPLGIRSVGFGAPTGDDPWGHRKRRVLRRWTEGVPINPGSSERPNVRADNPPVMSPAGRIHLTIGDWAKFIALFLTGGGRLVEPTSIAKIASAPEGPGPRQGMGWALPVGDTKLQYALGQQGTNTLWVATALVAPARDRAALVVCNDGRHRLLTATAHLALTLLGEGSSA